MGGDSLQFTYLRGRFVLGKQLDNKSAAQLAKLIDKGLILTRTFNSLSRDEPDTFVSVTSSSSFLKTI